MRKLGALRLTIVGLLSGAFASISCGSSSVAPVDAALPADAATTTEAEGSVDAAPPSLEASAGTLDAGLDPGDDASDDGAASEGEGAVPPDRFVESVVSFTPGPCAGFGASRMPGIVEGPPKGGGSAQGSLDVVSLGVGGEIVLSFAPNAIVDGPGADFIVFENVFDIGGNPQDPDAEPGEVSVSDDGVTWATFPCTATSYPYGSCAGWHPTFSAPGNGISPIDPGTAGGDPFDLAAVGVTRAQYVRIRDKSGEVCPDAGGLQTDGFDLDAVSIVNAANP